MTRLLKPQLLAAVLATVLLAPHAVADEHIPEGFEDDPRLGEEVNRMCFGRSINGFGESTDTTIILRARVNDHYLVETFGFCRDLEWAHSISLDTMGSCLSRGDTIRVYDSVFGPRNGRDLANRCRVRAIYEWNEDANDEAASEPESEAQRQR